MTVVDFYHSHYAGHFCHQGLWFFRKWQFGKSENIHIKSYDSDFGQKGDLPDFTYDQTGLVGCLFILFSWFYPPRITHKEFTIEILSETKEVLRHVKILLDKKEFTFLQTITS